MDTGFMGYGYCKEIQREDQMQAPGTDLQENRVKHLFLHQQRLNALKPFMVARLPGLMKKLSNYFRPT